MNKHSFWDRANRVDASVDGAVVAAPATVTSSEQQPPIGAATLLLLAGGGLALAAIGGAGLARMGTGRRPARAAQMAACGAALLASSVLADSAMEHYRGSFKKPAMLVAPTAAAVTLTTAVATALSSRFGALKSAVFGAAMATGLFGTGFHLKNILRRAGGLSFNNLFYRAPFGAPGALVLAGAAGVGAVAAERATQPAVRGRVRGLSSGRRQPALLAQPARQRVGRSLGAVTSAGLLGLVAEVGLLHFRGSFHNKLMYLPIACVPLTAAAVLSASAAPTSGRADAARRALQATAALGIVGTGLHAYGVNRGMGGFANWTQNLFSGPPVAAPPSLAGIALMGFAALDLLRPGSPDAAAERRHG